ncbi:putative ribonuclease III [Helianthus annuus]|nr:putative ribonuclease III [Helianthus annuus]
MVNWEELVSVKWDMRSDNEILFDLISPQKTAINKINVRKKGNVVESIEGDGERNACVGLQLLYSLHNSHYITGKSMPVYEFILDEGDSSSYRVLSSKTLADVVEALIGVYYVENGKQAANHFMKWVRFEVDFDSATEMEMKVRELQERCQQQAEGLEYKATRNGNLVTVQVFVDGVQVSIAQNSQKKMAQKLTARNALAVLKMKETEAAAKKKENEENGKKKNGSQTFTRQTLNDICLRRNWPMPLYRCVSEGGPTHAKRFIFAMRVNTSDKGKTLIAVLLIKSMYADLHKQGMKMLDVFLVPKVPLVYQQAEVIRDRWHREFEKKHVLVMTAQIILNILRHSIIKMEAINLLILDECHHAVKKHPYSLVMSEFYHTTTKVKRPSVLVLQNQIGQVNPQGIEFHFVVGAFESVITGACMRYFSQFRFDSFD